MLGTLLMMGLFIVVGMFFFAGKGSFLIAGFNTLPKEEKEKYDTVALCKFMGKMMFALAFSQIFWILSDLLEIRWLFIIGLVLFLGIVGFILFYVNTGNRFKNR
ncbi:DUF3784 domain-containing protein [Halalkalibacter okhensis]|uniref:DUF3784 domain-containing protein n=1 Tax=Halalkalibacter okhensis TaxID=333138 RepID=A0A0B0IPQ1_9BACI|nr:DUF3784 domain-containing protein [Halalkalibacter okhensis]KHF41656.1 hypothetical protein LQ50_02855 [Halalkalibacter okhensis]